MSTHAQPISSRVFLAAGSFVLAYCLLSGQTEFRYIVVSGLAGIFAASLAYIAVYITEQYVSSRPKVATKPETSVETQTIERPFLRYREFRRAVLDEGMAIVSKRALEQHSVCSRLDIAADQIINYLIEHEMVRDIGNSQYMLDEEKITAFLTEGQND